jgi:hypothetical protein
MCWVLGYNSALLVDLSCVHEVKPYTQLVKMQRSEATWTGGELASLGPCLHLNACMCVSHSFPGDFAFFVSQWKKQTACPGLIPRVKGRAAQGDGTMFLYSSLSPLERKCRVSRSVTQLSPQEGHGTPPCIHLLIHFLSRFCKEHRHYSEALALGSQRGQVTRKPHHGACGQ